MPFITISLILIFHFLVLNSAVSLVIHLSSHTLCPSLAISLSLSKYVFIASLGSLNPRLLPPENLLLLNLCLELGIVDSEFLKGFLHMSSHFFESLLGLLLF